ncbi:MAG: envelope integrity protein Cei [Pseudonocardiaceae bacterium]
MGTVGSSPAQHSTWYRARKPFPAIAVLVALAALAGLVWVSVLNRPDPTAGGCAAAASTSAESSAVSPSADVGQRLSAHSLDEVAPVPPQQVLVRVLNANGQRGEAGIVTTQLTELGFVPTEQPTNDPRHPGFDLRCHGEIRFGPAGEPAARTLSLVMPCAELVRHVRSDAVVELALGTEFAGLRPNDAAREALAGLTRLGQPILPTHGGQAAGVVAPAIDPLLLQQARKVDC